MYYSPSGQCCPEEEEDGCLIGEDDFNRADDTDLGSDWTEESGDWEIALDAALTEDSNAILKFDTPTPTVSQLLEVDIVISDEGGQARIYLGYVDATTNLSILIQTGVAGTGSSTAGGRCGVFSLYNGTTLLHTIPALDIGAGDTIALTGYYDSINGILWGRYVSGGFGGTTRYIQETVAPTGGLHAAIGTGSVPVGDVRFDNFRLSKADDSTGTGTGSGGGCPGIYDCTIAFISDESGAGCDATISGTPFSTAAGTGTSDAWSIASLIPASDTDRAGARLGLSVVMVSQDVTSTVTLNLGGYSATFTRLISPNRTTVAIGATTQTFSGHGDGYCLGIAGGVVSASCSLGGVHVALTGAPGANASASGTDGEVDTFEFSRCIECMGLACSLCPSLSAEAKSAVPVFLSSGICSKCDDPGWPGSLVLIYIAANQGNQTYKPPNQAYGGNNWVSYCLWGPISVLASGPSSDPFEFDPACLVTFYLYLLSLNDGRMALLFRAHQAQQSQTIAGKQWIKFYNSGDLSPCGPLANESLTFLSSSGGSVCIDLTQPVLISSD